MTPDCLNLGVFFIWGPDTLGATAITMPLGELYGALQNGTAEASEGPYEQLATNKFYEVQDLSLIHIFILSAPYIVSFPQLCQHMGWI